MGGGGGGETTSVDKITEIEKCDVVPRDIYLILGIILGASRVDT